jgi:hypothetical protein
VIISNRADRLLQPVSSPSVLRSVIEKGQIDYT